MEFLSTPVTLVVLGIILVYLIVIMIKDRKNKVNVKDNFIKCIPYMLIFFFPIVWYLVLKQHSYTHVNFTYRLLVISIISLLIFITKIFKPEEEKKMIVTRESK